MCALADSARGGSRVEEEECAAAAIAAVVFAAEMGKMDEE